MKIPMNKIVDMLKNCYKYEILEDEMTNNECDLCDKDLMRSKSYLVCVCSSEKEYEYFQDDPLSGEVLIFGSSCLQKGIQ